jgi:hypothetical protein
MNDQHALDFTERFDLQKWTRIGARNHFVQFWTAAGSEAPGRFSAGRLRGHDRGWPSESAVAALPRSGTL